VNIGVAVVDVTPGARIDPFYLGAQDETTVQGFAGTPVNVNGLTYDYLSPVGAAGASFPRQKRFYVVVDSGRDPFTGRSLAGHYVLRSWVNDVTPPSVSLLTTRVSAGRPTLVFRTTDTQSGVDPGSLTIGYKGALLAAAFYDRAAGLAVFTLPRSTPALTAGTRVRTKLISSDFQEAKNIDTIGPSIMPNTRVAAAQLHVVAGAAVDWLSPSANTCAAKRQRLVVAASAARPIASVRFAVDGRRFAVVRAGEHGLWRATLPARLAHGRHRLVATAVDVRGQRAAATRTVRACTG
jgi:hypothetical protein